MEKMMIEAATENGQPTRVEAESLLRKMLTELSLMQGSRMYLQNRVARQENFLSRVTVNDKPGRKEKIIRRLAAAQQELRALLADITTFQDRIGQLQRDLASA